MLKKTTQLIFVTLMLSACEPQPTNENVVKEFQCLTSQSECVLDTKFGRVMVQFDQASIITETPFEVAVTLEDISKQYQGEQYQSEQNTAFNKNIASPYQITHVQSFMEGKNMFMGKIPLLFENNKQHKRFSAETMLGSCTEQQMQWRLWLTITAVNTENNQELDETVSVDFTASRQ